MCGTKEQKSQRALKPGASRVRYFRLQGPGLELPGPLTANSKAARAIAGPTSADKRQLEVQVWPRPGRCPRCLVHVDSESVRVTAGGSLGPDWRGRAGAAPVLRLAVTPGQLNGHYYRPNSGRPLSAFICNGGPARCASDCQCCRRRPGPAAARAARLWVVLHYIPYIEIVRRLLQEANQVVQCNCTTWLHGQLHTITWS